MKCRFLEIILLVVMTALCFNVEGQQVNNGNTSNEYNLYFQAGERAFRNGDYYEARRQFKAAAAVRNNGNPEAANRKVSECNLAISRLNNNRTENNVPSETPRQTFEAAKLLFDSLKYNEALPIFQKVQNSIAESKMYIDICKERILESLGYIKINDMEFGSGGPLTGTVSGFNEPIYSSDLSEECYIKVKIIYIPLAEGTRAVTFHFRIWDEDGNMVADPLDPYGAYTVSWMERTIGEKGNLLGYFMLNLSPGKYRCETVVNNVVLFEKEFELRLKNGEASFFRINGQMTDLYEELNPEGGLYKYTVSTDASDLQIVKSTQNIEERCELLLIDSVLYVKVRPNYTLRPLDMDINLTAGRRTLKINFSQQANDNISSGDWISQLDSVSYGGKQIVRTYTYKGEDLNQKEHWNIIHLDEQMMWYIGKLDRQNNFLYGMLLTGNPDRYGVVENTAYYVGEFDKRIISTGNHYDRFGNLLFSGKSVNGLPFPSTDYPKIDEFYPSDHNMKQRMDYIVEDDGSAYLGEIVNGKRNGFGIYMWKNGDCWFGRWKSGKSVEGLFIDAAGTLILRNRFEDNKR